MRTRLFAAIIGMIAAIPAFGAADSLCEPLRAFVMSVNPGEVREFTFRTSWGSGFKDLTDQVMYEKRCEHGGYGPAKKVCEDLMETGSVEFPGSNAKRALECLSPETRFVPGLRLNQGSFSFSVGTDNRGATVDIELNADQDVGGMAFKVVSEGY